MSAFLGLNILMGINQLPKIKQYWDSDLFLGNAGFKTIMPSRRFWILNRYLSYFGPAARKSNRQTCGPLFQSSKKLFKMFMCLEKIFQFDEGLVEFNGYFYFWLTFKQYMPKKPNKFVIKVWKLADSETYFGRQQNAGISKGLRKNEHFQGCLVNLKNFVKNHL